MNTQNNENNDRFQFQTTEQKWRSHWQEIDLYKTGDDPHKPDIYILDFFPYPSGAGLSVGHCRNYVPTCVSTRFHRMSGYNVLHPMGWDAFGLPAENYAIKHGTHSRQSSAQFCANYKRQLQLIECAYDWSREIDSTDPDYYRWTQWFFLLLYQRGLAYRAPGSQWWCPQCNTVLANEQVEDGHCWRCHAVVERKDLEQWYFKITDYADRLADDLDNVDWPEAIKTMQRNWIGRSTGAEVIFTTPQGHRIPVFTTRPDTLFGVTYLAMAPEHPLLTQITSETQKQAVAEYVTAAQQMTEITRMAADRTKTGVFSGAYAQHPFTAEKIPVWVTDYVLMGYGSGAIMGVPAHDARDAEFARQFNLPEKTVVQASAYHKNEASIFTGEGTMINSGPYSGLSSAAGGAKITADLATRNLGGPQKQTKMRDWLISRQRYWGAPIPIIHCDNCGSVPVPEADLPVMLPDTNDFAPAGNGRSPLARISDWVNTPCPQCGEPAQRETDTLDGFACSSWYFLRFANPDYTAGPFDPKAVERWLPVDTYVGGAEHAVMHLLYARFWTKVMFDAGLIAFNEPFTQLRNQGVLHATDGRRMSKSKGNVITPDEVAAQYSTDALRAFVLFIGPFDRDVIWQENGIKGVVRFLERYWRLANIDPTQWQGNRWDEPFARKGQQTIKRVSDDMVKFRFNTAVATLMAYTNELSEFAEQGVDPQQWQQALETVTLMLCPIAPFITEEVWQTVLGKKGSVHQQQWPTYDETQAQDEQVTIVVQVNGKLRDRIVMSTGSDEVTMREKAVGSPKIKRFINGRPIHNTIVIKDKLVNFVV